MATQAQQTQLLTFLVGTFDAAPTAEIFAELTAAVDAGATVEGLADIIVGSDYFTSVYASTDAFVANFATDLVGSYVSEEVLSVANDFVSSEIAKGTSVTDVIVTALEALSGASADETWGAAATALLNKVTVAQYFIDNVSGFDFSSIADLQAILAGVTNEASTVTTAQDAIDVSAFTLTSGLEALDAANEAKADFLAAVDGDDDPDTSATETEVATALTDAQDDVDAAVVALSLESGSDDLAYVADDYNDASTAVKAAIVADAQEAAAALLADAEEALADAQEDVDAVAGLAAAQTAVETAEDVADAAALAETLAGNAFDAASTDFVSINSAVTDTLDADAGTGTYVLVSGTVTLIEYDADAEEFVLADGITEEDYEGITDVLNAVNSKAAAIVASDAADEALLNAELERNYLDLDTTAEADLEAIADAFQVTELGTNEMPTLAEIQTEISILEGLRDALNTALGEAADDAEVDTLLAAAVEDGILNADDVTEITAAYDTGAGTDHATGITAAQSALADYNTLDREAADYTGAVDGLQVLVDAFVNFTDSASGASSETNDLTDALVNAEDAITNDAGTGIQDLIDDLNDALEAQTEAQANVDELESLNDAIDAAEAAFEAAGYAVPVTIDSANEYATSGDDVFVVGDVSTSTVLNFGLLGNDQIFVGTDYVLNEGDLDTDGDNSVLEVFITEVSGNATITIENQVFGSNSSDAETVITLTGVSADEITFADGFISLV